MTERLIVAYGLIAIMVAAGIAIVWLRVYRSHHRTYAREQRRKWKRNPVANRKDLPGG